jgi:hypothetical protein
MPVQRCVAKVHTVPSRHDVIYVERMEDIAASGERRAVFGIRIPTISHPGAWPKIVAAAGLVCECGITGEILRLFGETDSTCRLCGDESPRGRAHASEDAQRSLTARYGDRWRSVEGCGRTVQPPAAEMSAASRTWSMPSGELLAADHFFERAVIAIADRFCDGDRDRGRAIAAEVYADGGCDVAWCFVKEVYFTHSAMTAREDVPKAVRELLQASGVRSRTEAAVRLLGLLNAFVSAADAPGSSGGPFLRPAQDKGELLKHSPLRVALQPLCTQGFRATATGAPLGSVYAFEVGMTREQAEALCAWRSDDRALAHARAHPDSVLARPRVDPSLWRYWRDVPERERGGAFEFLVPVLNGDRIVITRNPSIATAAMKVVRIV